MYDLKDFNDIFVVLLVSDSFDGATAIGEYATIYLWWSKCIRFGKWWDAMIRSIETQFL